MSEMKGLLGKTAAPKYNTLNNLWIYTYLWFINFRLEEMSGTSDDVVDGKNVHLLSIVWERIILDEAHQIRNPKCQTALAVCKWEQVCFSSNFPEIYCVCYIVGWEQLDVGLSQVLPFKIKSWTCTLLSGFSGWDHLMNTGIYDEILKFYDWDSVFIFRAWKVWVDNKTSLGQQRMNTLVRSMMLRRTKDQVVTYVIPSSNYIDFNNFYCNLQKSSSTGQELVVLPAKQVLEHTIT